MKQFHCWILILLLALSACKASQSSSNTNDTTEKPPVPEENKKPDPKEEKTPENVTVPIQEWPKQSRKPIIYLYPTEPTTIKVQLDFAGELTHTYPAYPNDGWEVLAMPDGQLKDMATGKQYYALFWEGKSPPYAQPSTGFVVKGSETAAFLEEKLAILGLNWREANEFIMYWLPELERNPYNFIHFADTEYTQKAKLSIQPQPESLIRVFMLYRGLEQAEVVNSQQLKPVKRKGFTVVEWGGATLATPIWNE